MNSKVTDRPLTVALDAEHTRQAAAGIARYGRSLAESMRKLGDVTVLELGGGEVVPRGTLRKRLLTARQDFLWYPWLGRRRADQRGADIYHIPLPRGPITKGKPPLVITVHDLVPVLFPETTTRWSRIYSRITFRQILDAADRSITPSQNTADDLNRILKLSPEKIRVVHNGVDQLFLDAGRQGIAAGRSRPSKPYVLFVGTTEPRKNLSRLASAMSIVRAKGFRERLTIVGTRGWGDSVAESTEIEILGRVTDDQLRALFTHASCVALPSLHEGFGLTALEAMATGTPVVAGNVGALPEVTGSAAVLVDPLSIEDIARGIIECITSSESLVAAGLQRAKRFTWERAAAATIAVYRELLP